MNKKVMTLVLSLILLVSFACKQKEQQPIPQMPMQGPGMGTPPEMGTPPGHGAPGGIVMAKGESQVVVPAAVKGRWSAVKLTVEDKKSKNVQEFVVKLNSDLNIPNSSLKISVGEFLPDFRMDAGTITSVSNEPNSPAVAIKVFEGDRQIFPEPGKKWGWLFSRFPGVHSFDHPKFGIKLKEGLKKG